MEIKDSGNRRTFETGAQRDCADGRGRCDLMPLGVIGTVYRRYFDEKDYGAVLDTIERFKDTGDEKVLIDALISFMELTDYDGWSDLFLEVSKHFEAGAKKYDENNWKLGINAKCYVDSATRHYLKWLRGDKDEPHDRAFVWNIICCVWTCQHKSELNDYRLKE